MYRAWRIVNGYHNLRQCCCFVDWIESSGCPIMVLAVIMFAVCLFSGSRTTRADTLVTSRRRTACVTVAWRDHSDRRPDNIAALLSTRPPWSSGGPVLASEADTRTRRCTCPSRWAALASPCCTRTGRSRMPPGLWTLGRRPRPKWHAHGDEDKSSSTYWHLGTLAKLILYRNNKQVFRVP